MSAGLLYGLTGLALFGLGLAALFIHPAMLRKILAINIGGSGIFLLMISVAYDPDGGGPDPVLHALVLTGIVITVSITAFALALARPDETGTEQKQVVSAAAGSTGDPVVNRPPDDQQEHPQP